MHFDVLPKITHNDDAVREYEQQENRRVRRWLLRIALALLVLGGLAWLLLHFDPGLLVAFLSTK